jgi:SagB-type dehydrogenase family enzyme
LAAWRLRRSRHIVLYWQKSRLVAHNYATGRLCAIRPVICSLLEFCDEWRTLDAIAATMGVSLRDARVLATRLIDRGLLERSDRTDPRVAAMSVLDPWNPAAGFFHAATKNVRFWSPAEATRQARAKGTREPMPDIVKRYPRVPTVRLPPPARGPFRDLLLGRRTWRRFAAAPLTIEELGSMLGLALGIQQWVEAKPRRLALRTSPSGGSRHPIEAYVAVQNVRGVPKGYYHYRPDRHLLERLPGRLTPERVRSYYPSSGHFSGAPVHVFLTAVLTRQLWRYPYARAYRAALAESGHICQTLCLAATWLGLAPFCLMGLADTRIEDDLGLDGTTETVLYAAGAGRRPKGTNWAPLTRGTLQAHRNRHL